MSKDWRRLIKMEFLVATSVIALGSNVGADLFGYVGRDEPECGWSKNDEKNLPSGKVIDLHLVSQVWRNIRWEHRLLVFVPQKIEFPRTAVLMNTGGDAGLQDRILGTVAANSGGCVFATLHHVPNQPLFDGRTEDDLIAYTFEQYLLDGDETWPLLFPMVKSVVKAMDAMQAWSQKEMQEPIEGFIITGASKRGWTTWLTAAVDRRVKGIMPMVYDNLNIAAQMPHQLRTWGAYSEQIDDYTRRGLQQQLGTERGKKLVSMIDPYTYCHRLMMPKLIINGTNDRYWTLDALNLYWNALKGPKFIFYTPNAGHSLQSEGVPITNMQDFAFSQFRPLRSMITFCRMVAGGQHLPRLNWKYSTKERNTVLTLTGAPLPKEAFLWTARSDTRDFRSSHWESTMMTAGDRKFTGRMGWPERGFAAMFGEAFFELSGSKCSFSTQVRIIP